MSELWRRLRVLFHRDRLHRDLEEEMQFHLEMQAGKNQKKGMSAEEARYAARRQFGNPMLLAEDGRCGRPEILCAWCPQFARVFGL